MPDEEAKKDTRRDFMSDEEVSLVDDYLAKIEQRRSDYSPDYTRWEAEAEAYAGDQPIDDNSPNTRVNIVNANIEGQVAALVEQNIAVVCRGEGPSDRGFADWARIGLDWTLRKNHIKRLLERHERRRELFGPAWFKLSFDPDAVQGFGLVRITCPPPEAMYVDGKISDPFNLQDAAYIAEVMEDSKAAAIEEFGDRAEAIHFGGTDPKSVFAKPHSIDDDDDLYWKIQLWAMCKPEKGKKRVLRLMRFSDDGVLLSDSFRKWNGKHYEELKNPKPFYRYNLYPYWLTNLYYEEGKLLGFGDGKLLRPLQDMLNDLYDQARRQARPPRIFFDESSDVDIAALDEDDGPVPARDPNSTIRVVEVGKVNDSIWRLIENLHVEVQRVIRFSELMMSVGTNKQTATESAIQQQQGATGIDHKKLMLQETLVDVCEYALDLMIENYTEAKAFRIDEDKDDYAWIDFRDFDKAPVMVPATAAFEQEWTERNPDLPAPEFEVLKDKNGKDMTKSVDLDIEVTIGAGLPKNKAFLYQMLERLAPLVAVDKAGMQKPVLTWEELRNFIEDFLGLPLEQPEEMAAAPVPQPQVPGQPPMPNAMAQGLTAGGAPQQPVPVAAGGAR